MASETLFDKYSPKTIDDIKLPKRIRELIDSKLNTVGFRLLFYGTAGLGKSTTAKIITKMMNYSPLYMSGSNNVNIEVMRSQITPFCSNYSIDGKGKIFILDECENISGVTFDSMKMLSDQAKKTNIILITNKFEKIPDPIRSRFVCVDFNFQGTEMVEQKRNYAQLLVDICKNEGIKYDPEGLQQIIKKLFPDFRKLLNFLQRLIDEKLDATAATIKSLESVSGQQNTELYKILDGSAGAVSMQDFYQSLTKFKGQEEQCVMSLGEDFFNYLNAQGKYDKTLKAAVIVANYSNQLNNSLSKFVTFLACCAELQSLLR